MALAAVCCRPPLPHHCLKTNSRTSIQNSQVCIQSLITIMAVKDKSDCIKETSESTSIEWNVENELQLLLVLCGTKPIGKHFIYFQHLPILCRVYIQMFYLGISKYFQMACIVEKLSSNLNKEVTAKGVWDHLSTMYDLKKFVSIAGE